MLSTRLCTHLIMAGVTAASPRTLASTLETPVVEADDGPDAQQVATTAAAALTRPDFFICFRL